MKNLIRTLAALVLVSSIAQTPAFADSFDRPATKGNGVGIILGQPTGFTGKFWISHNQAIDLGVAFGLDSFFLVYGDYLVHFHGAFGRSNEFLRQLEPYAGIGAVLFVAENNGNGKYFTSNGDTTGMGVRIPLGAEWLMRTAPIGIFAEIVPGMGVVPSTFAFIQGGIGARFYF